MAVVTHAMQSINDIVARCTDRVRESMKQADRLAGDRRCANTYPVHVLHAIALGKPGVACAVLDRIGIPIQQHVTELNVLAKSVRQTDNRNVPQHIPIAEILIREAKLASDTFGHDYIGTEHLLLGILTAPPNLAADFLTSHGATGAAVRTSIHAIFGFPNEDG